MSEGTMNNQVKSADCADFQKRLPELIGTGRSSDDPHVKECALCRELLESLQTIAEAARQLFPEVEPPDEVWHNIESAIKRDASGARLDLEEAAEPGQIAGNER